MVCGSGVEILSLDFLLSIQCGHCLGGETQWTGSWTELWRCSVQGQEQIQRAASVNAAADAPSSPTFPLGLSSFKL